MEDWQKGILENIYDLASKYYTERTANGVLTIPDSQPEKEFIQEVFQACYYILEEPNNN